LQKNPNPKSTTERIGEIIDSVLKTVSSYSRKILMYETATNLYWHFNEKLKKKKEIQTKIYEKYQRKF
jgi:hypothetical protein